MFHAARFAVYNTRTGTMATLGVFSEYSHAEALAAEQPYYQVVELLTASRPKESAESRPRTENRNA